MKNIIYFFTLPLLFSISVGSALATVFRVNNSLTENIPGGLFTTIQRAHDHFSVKNDDTLMVEGSAKNYDGFTFTKRLVVIGPGYFLGENADVNSVVTSALVSGYSYLNNGSGGSYIIGMEFSYGLEVNVSNTYILKSKIGSLYFRNGASNCKVAMSHINGIDGYLNGSGISVTNSIINDDNTNISYLIYENNILVGTRNSTWRISAGTFRNNILLERDAKVEIKSPSITNNLAPNAQFGTTNGNRAFEPADVFIGTGSSDSKYRIKANSPYIAVGVSGTQPGLFGGSEPYVLSGIPPVPIIYELNVPGTGSAASGLTINVKIRGAN